MKKYHSTMRRILNYIGHYKWGVLVSLLLAAVSVAGTLYVPILTGEAVDRIVAPGQVDFEGLVQILIRMGVVIAAAAGA